MDWKKFLKPDWKKIILAIILFAISSLISKLFSVNSVSCSVVTGFPLSYYYEYTGQIGLAYNPFCVKFEPHMSYFGLIVDIIFWYSVACVLVFAYEKYKKRK